ncbi:MAG TPA: hypothetical protein VHH73_12145 [Verrucomicrobiae bacterium]|nr:hypothetical protein [Verrucomicrobiae bacterium]
MQKRATGPPPRFSDGTRRRVRFYGQPVPDRGGRRWTTSSNPRADGPTIAIILYREKDKNVVEYTFHDAKSPVGVAECRLLPTALKALLPETRQFGQVKISNKAWTLIKQKIIKVAGEGPPWVVIRAPCALMITIPVLPRFGPQSSRQKWVLSRSEMADKSSKITTFGYMQNAKNW